ncbi:zinc finger in N-recognin protein, partial [Toxoplasma gondii RUB]
YAFLLRRQIVQLLATQPCTLSRLERAVGRSGRLHPSFASLLEELTTSTVCSRRGASGAAVPQIRSSRALLGAAGQASSAPLLRLKKESWKCFDAFGASERLIAAGVSRKREHLGNARADMQVAEEEALRHPEAPLLWPSRAAGDMAPEFFHMQDLLVDALVGDDEHHLLFRLLLQLLQAKNRGPDFLASPSSPATGSSTTPQPAAASNNVACVSHVSPSSSLSSSSPESSSSSPAPSSIPSSSSSCGAFLHDPVCSALKLLDALAQARRRGEEGPRAETQRLEGDAKCGVIPPVFLRCLRSEVERLHEAESTFAEVRRYCRTLLSRLPVSDCKPKAGGTSQSDEAVADAAQGAGREPHAPEVSETPGVVGGSAAGPCGARGDGGEARAGQPRPTEETAPGAEDSKEDAGLSEGARKQRQMLLTMQQRQRDFHSFLEDADMLSESDAEEDSGAGMAESCRDRQVEVDGEIGEEGGAARRPTPVHPSRGGDTSGVNASLHSTFERVSSREGDTREETLSRGETSLPVSPSLSPLVAGPAASLAVSPVSVQRSSPKPLPHKLSLQRRQLLTKEEEEMRCGVCLEGHTVARPLALLGHLSQTNMLRRFAQKGRGSLPASHPAFNSCGHVAHVSCLRALQETGVSGRGTRNGDDRPGGAPEAMEPRAEGRPEEPAGRERRAPWAPRRAEEGERRSRDKQRFSAFACPTCRRIGNCFLVYVPRTSLTVDGSVKAWPREGELALEGGAASPLQGGRQDGDSGPHKSDKKRSRTEGDEAARDLSGVDKPRRKKRDSSCLAGREASKEQVTEEEKENENRVQSLGCAGCCSSGSPTSLWGCWCRRTPLADANLSRSPTSNASERRETPGASLTIREEIKPTNSLLRPANATSPSCPLSSCIPTSSVSSSPSASSSFSPPCSSFSVGGRFAWYGVWRPSIGVGVGRARRPAACQETRWLRRQNVPQGGAQQRRPRENGDRETGDRDRREGLDVDEEAEMAPDASSQSSPENHKDAGDASLPTGVERATDEDSSFSQEGDYFPADAIADSEVEEAKAKTRFYPVGAANPVPGVDLEMPRRGPARRGLTERSTRRRLRRREREGSPALACLGDSDILNDSLDSDDAAGHSRISYGALCDACQFRNRFFRLHAFPERDGMKALLWGDCGAVQGPTQKEVDTLLCKRRNGGPIHPDFFIAAWRSIERLGHISWVSRLDSAEAFLDSAISAFASSSSRRLPSRAAYTVGSPPWRELRELHFLPFYPCPSNWNLPPHPAASQVTHAFFNFHTAFCDPTRRRREGPAPVSARARPSGDSSLRRPGDAGLTGRRRRDRERRGRGERERDEQERDEREREEREREEQERELATHSLLNDATFFTLFAAARLGQASEDRMGPIERRDGSASEGGLDARALLGASVAAFGRTNALRALPSERSNDARGGAPPGPVADPLRQRRPRDPGAREESRNVWEAQSRAPATPLPLCPDCGGVRVAQLKRRTEEMPQFAKKALSASVVNRLSPCMCWTVDELSAWRGAGAGMHLEVLEWCAYTSVLLQSSVEAPGGREEASAPFCEETEPWVQVVRNCFLLDAFPARCFAWLADITCFGYWSAGNRFPRSYLQLATTALTAEQEERQCRARAAQRARRQRRKRGNEGQGDALTATRVGGDSARTPHSDDDQKSGEKKVGESGHGASSSAASSFPGLLSSFFAPSSFAALSGRKDQQSEAAAAPAGCAAQRQGSSPVEGLESVSCESAATSGTDEEESRCSCSSGESEGSLWGEESSLTAADDEESDGLEARRARLREHLRQLHWLPRGPKKQKRYLSASAARRATKDSRFSPFSSSSVSSSVSSSRSSSRSSSVSSSSFDSEGEVSAGAGGRRANGSRRRSREEHLSEEERSCEGAGDAEGQSEARCARRGQTKKRDETEWVGRPRGVLQRRRKARRNEQCHEADRQRLRSLQIEERCPVWEVGLDRKFLLFNPWACDVKGEFLKAFFSRVLKTPAQIKMRLSELLCIRALQIANDVLVDEAGDVFASQFPSSAPSTPTDTLSLPIEHPVHRHAFAAFWRDWLQPWEESGDLPGTLSESLSWYGFSFLERLAELRGTLGSRDGSDKAPSSTPDASRASVHTFPSQASVCSPAAAAVSRHFSSVPLPSEFPPPTLTEVEKENLAVSSRYLSQCAPDCSKEGVQWVYRACRRGGDLSSFSAILEEEVSQRDARSASPQSEDARQTCPASGALGLSEKLPARPLAPGAASFSAKETPPLAAVSPIYGALANGVACKAEQNKEINSTPLLGASGPAYAGPDRLHRLDRLLGDGKTREVFWKLLAGKLPQRPSLLSLLQRHGGAETCGVLGKAAAANGEGAERGEKSAARRSATAAGDRRRWRGQSRKGEEGRDKKERDKAAAEDGRSPVSVDAQQGVEEKERPLQAEDERRGAVRGKGSEKGQMRRHEDTSSLLAAWLQARAGSLPELFEALTWQLMRRECLRFGPHVAFPKARGCCASEEATSRLGSTQNGDAIDVRGLDSVASEGEEAGRRPSVGGESFAKKRHEKGQEERCVAFERPRATASSPADQRRGREACGDAAERETSRKRCRGNNVSDEGGVLGSLASEGEASLYPSGPLCWACFTAPEAEVRDYVQELWRRFESRFVVAMTSFLRFAVWLISPVWRLDPALLSRLRASLRDPPGEAQLRLLLHILHLPLRFEERLDPRAAGRDTGEEKREKKRGNKETKGEKEQNSMGGTKRKSSAHCLRGGRDVKTMRGEEERCGDERKTAPHTAEASGVEADATRGKSVFSVPKPTVLSTVCRLMFSPVVVEGAAAATERRVDLSPPGTDNLKLLPLHLPTDFLDLLRQTLLRKCPHCGDSPEHKALCLVCGAVVCVGSSCCKEEGSSRDAAWGECMLHAHTCGGGSGLFLLVEQSMLFAVDGSSWFPLESVYVDDGGESDPRLRRGLGRLTLHEPCARQLSWLLMNGRLLPFVSRSYIRPFSLSDAMTVRWP